MSKEAFEADEKTVSFTAEDSNLTLRREALQRILAPESDKPEDETSGGTLNVDADLPLKMRVKQCRLPKAIFAGEPIEPEQVKVDLLLTGGPLKVANADGEKAELDNLRLTVGTDNLADGVNFSLSGKAAGGGQDASGGLQVNGNLAGLLAKNSTLDPSRAFVQMTADGQQVPTAIADMLGSMDGLLVAAVGPMMNIRATAENFSSTTGNLDFRVDTDNGWLEGAVQGKSHSLRIDKTKPVKAELALTEPLRERLLRKIHPLLGDIRSTEQPLRMTVPGAVIPIDGDVAKLRADLEITVGAVELDSGSTIFLLLSLAKQTHKATIKGHIDPINVAIRDGIETYRSFSVRLDKYTLVYSGQIDLIKGEVDLKTRIPLEGLAGTFQELEGYADKIVVPLVTRGKFGQLKTGVDPDFDLGEAAVQAGFNGLLDNVLKDTGLPIGDLLKLFDESKGKQDDK